MPRCSNWFSSQAQLSGCFSDTGQISGRSPVLVTKPPGQNWILSYSLEFSPSPKTFNTFSFVCQVLCHFFAYFITNKSTVACQKILMVYESCKTAPCSLVEQGFGEWVHLCVRSSGGGSCWLVLEGTAKETVSRFSHSLIPNNQDALIGHNQKKKTNTKKSKSPMNSRLSPRQFLCKSGWFKLRKTFKWPRTNTSRSSLPSSPSPKFRGC